MSGQHCSSNPLASPIQTLVIDCVWSRRPECLWQPAKQHDASMLAVSGKICSTVYGVNTAASREEFSKASSTLLH